MTTAPRARNGRNAGAAKPTDRGEARSALLAAASTLFGERAYDLVSCDDIAAEAGLSKGLIYYYFNSKRGLFLALIKDAAESLNSLAEEYGDVSPAERLIRTLDGYLWWADTHRSAFHTITSGGIGVDTEVAAVYTTVRSRLLTTMSRTLVGTPDPPPLLRIALDGWLAFVEGITASWLRTPGTGRAAVRDLAIDILVSTLAAAGHPIPAEES
ncbi:TetR/AcrR family transcriptional regulator [Actinocorallia populi]|uniref:TetR/AcrR family transcriptional regulator n=1 Tax=Actinocorallia populi TaxID=2079200 RepID=UPI000D091C5E|nr:TetR/AcrR family transcriptional regulator [Actinocorallia populi]